jgi:putative FmdB family regulatory protein
MPIYEYSCVDCGHDFEVLVRGEEKPSCPACGQSHLTKNLSVPAAPHTTASEPVCPARESCGAKHCCGNGCGMGDFM